VLPVKAWRIYYADGSTFTSDDGTWAEAPPFGVQAVVYYHIPEGYKTVDTGGDEGVVRWLDGSEVHPDYQGIKLGLWIDREGCYRILRLADGSSGP
jgi:hypothetical protein